MYFRVIEEPRGGGMAYLLADLPAQVAVVIDPPPGQEALILALLDERALKLAYVLRTHAHGAACGAPCALCERTGAQLAAASATLDPAAGLTLQDGDALVFGAQVLRVLATPGHTPHCLSFLWHDRLFCGDVFDVGGCAVGDSESDPALLYDTLSQRIFTLPGETLLFPAHRLKGRGVSTVEEERRRQAALIGRSRESFVTEMAFRRLVRPRLQQALEDVSDPQAR